MEKDETIVTDISEELDKPALSGRDAVMQGILEDRAEGQLRELEGQLVPGAEQETVGPEVEDELEAEPVSETVEDEYTTVKVNGRSYEVETEKVENAGGIEAYQRIAAASEKQREVAEREAALKKREEELAEIERKLLNPEPTKVEENGEFGKNFADQIFDDPEAVAEAMNALESRTRAAMEKAEEAQSRLERKEREEQQKQQKTVVQYFWTNHVNIAKDQEFTNALNSRMGVIAGDNPHLSHEQIVDLAADQVYEKFNIPREQAPPAEDQKKQNRKPVKTPSRATSRKPPKPEVKQQTPDEIVRDLAKLRTPQRSG